MTVLLTSVDKPVSARLETSASSNTTVKPITIILIGFTDSRTLIPLLTLFTHANRWQQPWKLVNEITHAEFFLINTDQPYTSASLQSLPYQRLIAYSTEPSPQTRWHLPRSHHNPAPSPLEFTLLLKQIGQVHTTSEVIPSPPAAISSCVQTIPPTALTTHETTVSLSTSRNTSTPNAASPLETVSTATQPKRLKLLIIGSVGSGKTTAIHTLSQSPVVSTEVKPSDHVQLQKKSTTVAMDFGTSWQNEQTQLMIYGAPGQRRFDFMSQILLNKTSGLIILISNTASNPLSELKYYLDAHQEFLKQNKAVIGITHNDLKPTPSLSEYNEFIKERGENWPVLKVDARNTDDMQKLLLVLLDTINR